jgi:DNA helicase HerA-like ATPase
MAKYKIGKTVSVYGDTFSVQLTDHQTGDEIYGVPEDMTIHPTFDDNGPVPILIGQPGSFVDVMIPGGSLLCMVVGVRMSENPPRETEVREAIAAESLFTGNSAKRYLEVTAVGTINPAGKFERGTDVLPTVGSDVFAVPNATIQKIYESYSEGNFSLGKISVLPEQDAKVNLNTFLSRHAAIIGQTGAGKSWTVASVLQKIAQFPQSTVVLFDLHGEYEKAFGPEATYVSAADIELPYWLMNSEELLEICVDRHESTAPNQIAKFRELLQTQKEITQENVALGIPKITIDTPVYFEFDAIIEELRTLDTAKKPGSREGSWIKGDFEGQFTRMLMRLESRVNDKRFDLIFKPKTYTSSASMEHLFQKLLGEEVEPKKIVVLDLSPVPFDVRSSVISLLFRCLFDFGYWYKKVNGKSYPISIFADEAHSYLNENEISHRPSRVSAERIAKEGRKYGLSLTIITQRPREVSATILSQCNSFLCLRITNPDDQGYVKNLLTDSMRGIVSIFATLRRGEAILIGDAVMMPTRIKVDEPNPKPDSDDVSFTGAWSQQHSVVDIASTLTAWRKQSTT